MKKRKIIILTNGFHKPMGVFSKGYRNDLPFEKVVLFGGICPFFREGTPRWKQKLVRRIITLVTLKNEKRIEKIKSYLLKRILKKEKTDCALAEYLHTGAGSFETLKTMNIPLISNVLGFEIHLEKFVEKFEERYKKLAEYQSFTIPVAKDMIPKLEKLGFPKERIIYSPIGPAEDFFQIEPKFQNKQFVLIGRMTATKSPVSTVLAFHKVLKKIPDATLVMAGDGELLNDVKNKVEELNISKSVTFTGWINQEKQKELYADSICFVQHSVVAPNGDREGTPVAILEASAAGLPVVSTFLTGIRDTVIHGETGFLVKEHDWETMGDYMIKILENLDEAQKMGQKGKQFVHENFSLKKHLEIVTGLINKAIEEKSS